MKGEKASPVRCQAGIAILSCTLTRHTSLYGDVGSAHALHCSVIGYVACEEFCFFWRRERDLNPRTGHPVSGFQDRRLKPLGHPSLPGPALGQAWTRSMALLELGAHIKPCRELACF